jgi:hypothetical protein
MAAVVEYKKDSRKDGKEGAWYTWLCATILASKVFTAWTAFNDWLSTSAMENGIRAMPS